MNRKERRSKNVRAIFMASRYDQAVATHLAKVSKDSPEVILDEFIKFKENLSDQGYWYILSTIWNSYPMLGTDEQWIALLKDQRHERKKSMMTPKEQKKFKRLPEQVLLVKSEDSRIFQYTLAQSSKLPKARNQIALIPKKWIIAYFAKRDEVLVNIPKDQGIEPKEIILDDPVVADGAD